MVMGFRVEVGVECRWVVGGVVGGVWVCVGVWVGWWWWWWWWV